MGSADRGQGVLRGGGREAVNRGMVMRWKVGRKEAKQGVRVWGGEGEIRMVERRGRLSLMAQPCRYVHMSCRERTRKERWRERRAN